MSILPSTIMLAAGILPGQSNPKPDMTYEEKMTIRRFARGRGELRDAAVSIHRRYIATLGVRGTPEQRFMAEIDNPCPDLTLRSQYRQVLREVLDE